MKLTLKLLFIVSTILLTINANGQLNFRKGYIVTINNDTIRGKIYDGGSLMGREFCLFQSEDGKIKKYSPSELKSYKIDGDKLFRAIDLLDKGKLSPFFTEVLLDGNYSLIYDFKNKNTSYYLETEKGILIPLSNMDLPVRRYSDFGYTSYSSLNNLTIELYKDTLIQLFGVDKPTVKKIINLEYRHNDLMNFTKMQIEKTCEGKECISYEKDLFKNKDRIGFYYGKGFQLLAYKVKSSDLNGEKESSTTSPSAYPSSPIGFFYTIPVTILGDRLSFQVEAATSMLSVESGSGKSRIIVLPFSLRYATPLGIITPTIAIGKGLSFVLREDYEFEKLYKTQRDGLFLDLGLDYRITKGISLFNTLRFQSFSNLYGVDSEKLSYSEALKRGNYRFEYQTYIASILVGIKF